jgi:hypothetical protein
MTSCISVVPNSVHSIQILTNHTHTALLATSQQRDTNTFCFDDSRPLHSSSSSKCYRSSWYKLQHRDQPHRDRRGHSRQHCHIDQLQFVNLQTTNPRLMNVGDIINISNSKCVRTRGTPPSQTNRKVLERDSVYNQSGGGRYHDHHCKGEVGNHFSEFAGCESACEKSGSD